VNGTLVIQVNNNNMSGDPAVGGDKVLTVIYRYQGREQTSTVKEGNTLRIPWGFMNVAGHPTRINSRLEILKSVPAPRGRVQ
jgi:hypothetical protein